MKSRYAKISRKHWWDMTQQEQEAQHKELDKPIAPGQMKPLSKKQRIIWERMRGSRPHISIYVSNGRADVVIHLDDELLERARHFARKNKTTLPEMIDKGLRGLLAFAG